MKLNEKWTLFLIATFTTFFGVVDTIVGKTFASELVINEEFSDINFYKCVVESYNNLNNKDYDYRKVILSDEELSSISNVECVGYDKLDEDRVKDIKGIEKLTSLKYIDLRGNNLSYVDFTKNNSLVDFKIDISSYIYEGDIIDLKRYVRVPNNIKDNIDWISGDESIVKIDKDDKAIAMSSGDVVVNGQIIGGITINNYVNVISLSSLKYLIDTENEFIYIGEDDSQNLSNYLDVGVGDIDVSNDSELLFVKHEENVLKEFKIFDIEFIDYNVVNKSINLVNSVNFNDFINNIVCDELLDIKIFKDDEYVNSSDILDGMQLRIYYDNKLLDTFDINILDFDIEMDVLLDKENNYIKYIPSGLTVEEFLDKINILEDFDIVIYDNKNVRKYGSSRLASGDVICIRLNGKLINQYKLSILGDSSGDGIVDLVDLLQMRKHLVGYENNKTGEIEMLNGVYYYALDLNMDGKVDLLDLVKIRKNIVRMI